MNYCAPCNTTKGKITFSGPRYTQAREKEGNAKRARARPAEASGPRLGLWSRVPSQGDSWDVSGGDAIRRLGEDVPGVEPQAAGAAMQNVLEEDRWSVSSGPGGLEGLHTGRSASGKEVPDPRPQPHSGPWGCSDTWLPAGSRVEGANAGVLFRRHNPISLSGHIDDVSAHADAWILGQPSLG